MYLITVRGGITVLLSIPFQGDDPTSKGVTLLLNENDFLGHSSVCQQSVFIWGSGCVHDVSSSAGAFALFVAFVSSRRMLDGFFRLRIHSRFIFVERSGKGIVWVATS